MTYSLFCQNGAPCHHGREEPPVVKADLHQLVAVVLAHEDLLYPRVTPAEDIDALRRVRVQPHLLTHDPAQTDYPLPQINPVSVKVDRVLA